MNGIRLAVVAVAALALLQIDCAELLAQRGGAYGDFYKNQGRNQSGRSGQAPTPGPPQDQPSEAPGADDGSRGNSRSGGSRSSGRSSSSRSSSPRRGSSSRSQSDNAIESNPMLKFFDTDGDGELSLEEIDAASRMLLSLDKNNDDYITSDEVEDMMADGGDSGSSRSSQGSSSRSSNSRSSTSRSSRPSSRPTTRDQPGEAPPAQMNKFAKGGGAAAGPGGGFSSSAPPGPPGFGGPPRTSSRSKKSDVADDDFPGHDKDGDGVLKRGEMPRSLRSKFTRIDSNKDGEVDEDEFFDYLDEQGK